MKWKNRIYLKTNDVLREFLWLQKGKDGSIYLGQTKKMRYGRKGQRQINDAEPGAKINLNSGQNMEPEELGGKVSFHKSGIVNLSTITVDKRDRLKTKEFSEFKGILPLTGIIPMLPTKYPRSNKTLKNRHPSFEYKSS